MNLSSFQFIHWQWLWLILILCGILIWWYQRKDGIQTQASMIDLDLSAYQRFYHPLVKQLIESSETSLKPKVFWKKAAFWLHLIIFTLLIISLAQPVLIGKRLPDPPPERDIVFLVDTSLSMQLKDYQQDGVAIKRIEVLRSLLDEFVVKMRGEKLSIILFAEKSYILVPLTSDQNLIRKMLRRITTTLAGRYTAIGDALLMALNETQNSSDKKRHKTFILFTDADASRGEVTSMAAATLVAEHQIPVYTIAIGSSNKDPDKDVSGGLFSTVDLALLEEISELTHGKSYQVNDSEAIKKALQSILKQSQNVAIPKPSFEQEALYFYFLLLALLLLVLSQAIKLIPCFKECRGSYD
ncbi:MAG: VWA domain-containing protein [Cocleimonas sp.]